MEGSIYFLRAKESGNIKIGFSHDPDSRKKMLQTATWEELEIIGEIPGSLTEEHRIRKRFSHLQIRGEWFHPAKALLDFIEKGISQTKNTISSLGQGRYRFEFSWPVELNKRNLLLLGTRPLNPLIDERRALIIGLEGERRDILAWAKDNGVSTERLEEMKNVMKRELP